jgi:hypothetical protein
MLILFDGKSPDLTILGRRENRATNAPKLFLLIAVLIVKGKIGMGFLLGC